MNKFIAPNTQEQFAKLRAELRIGLVLNTEFGAFAAIEHLSESRFQSLVATGEACVILSRRRALDLQFSHDPSSPAALRLPKDYRFGNLKSLADPSLDMDYPGKGPLAQASLSAKHCDHMLNFCRDARTLPAVIFLPTKIPNASEITQDIWQCAAEIQPQLEKISQARVPLKRASASQFLLFRDQITENEHYAIIIGGTLSETPLVRLHSACFTGDCLGSLKCDCGPQLHRALEMLNQNGGVLLYLSQEGRGIGLANKIRAYHLQDQGFDTVEANHKLGFQDDERDFRIGAEILKKLKIEKLDLLTNNPRKIQWLEAAGLKIRQRVPIQIEPNAENKAYLATKTKKSGHLL